MPIKDLLEFQYRKTKSYASKKAIDFPTGYELAEVKTGREAICTICGLLFWAGDNEDCFDCLEKNK